MYVVLRDFIDLKDKEYSYRKGDVYPRGNTKPTLKRVEELESGYNLQNKPLILKVNIPDKTEGKKKK